jgi:NTE family protein
LNKRQGPTIVINASDLGYGVRFSFIQEYFNLLCSDISTFSIARAVAASSAVPVLFHPIVLENHGDCPKIETPGLTGRQNVQSTTPNCGNWLINW